MTVAIVGGRQRLKQYYRSVAAGKEMELKFFCEPTPDIACRIAQADAVILFTDMVSHRSAKEVYKISRESGLSLICSHNSSLTSAKRCMNEAREREKNRTKISRGGLRPDKNRTNLVKR